MKVVAPSGAMMCGRLAGAYSFALAGGTFDAILLRGAARAGAVVGESTGVQDLLWDGRAVAGVVARGGGDGKRETWRARVVVGADGLRSVVARRLGLLRASAPRRVAFTAHVAHVAGVDGVGELHVGETGYVGRGPVGEGVSTVALVVPLRSVRAGGTDYRAGLFAQLVRFPGLAGRFDPRQMVRVVLAVCTVDTLAIRPCVAGALLVGGAADFFG